MNDIETGPVRPPSESNSLLIRVTRGCHWNKCYFCGLYKSMKFSMRPIEDIISDIKVQSEQRSNQRYKSCFLQDGDALVLKTEYLLKILDALHHYFPALESVTTYARADSITRKSLSELKLLREYGLNHLYCGMETGSDRVLQLVNKGFDSNTVIQSGCLAKEANMTLSEFILLGIGGKEYSEENARKTANALNIIRPDFIRVHATGFKPGTMMWQLIQEGTISLQSEEEIVREQRLFLQCLKEMNSYYVNEHIVNLLLEVRGNLLSEKDQMLSDIDRFLSLPPEERLLFAVGRRFNVFFFLDDLKKSELRSQARLYMDEIKKKDPNVDFAFLCNYVRQSQI